MGPATTSAGLIERFRSGDQAAFDELYARHRTRLGVLAHYKMSARLRERYEVDDVLQEVFLEAARDLAQFTYRSPDSFYRWLARIAARVIVDLARNEGRRKRDGGVAVTDYEPVDSHTPSRLFREQEQAGALLARLDTLPEDYRTVILLAKFEGLATADIAEQMGKTREQVALLLHRALKRYRGAT